MKTKQERLNRKIRRMEQVIKEETIMNDYKSPKVIAWATKKLNKYKSALN